MVHEGPLDARGESRSRRPVPAEGPAIVFKPAAGRLPSPEALAKYAEVDPSYPQHLMESFRLELVRNYRYQVCALIAGWSFALCLALEAGFLAMRGHEKLALVIIGANALGLATRMLPRAASRD